MSTVPLIADLDLGANNTLGLASRARFGAVLRDASGIEALVDAAAEKQLPLHVLGGGSNVVLRPFIEALVVRMATSGRFIEDAGDETLVTAAAGEDWPSIVAWTVAQGLAGLENLAGIPGTVGAAPIQNIGAYGLELAQRFKSLTAYDTVTRQRRVFAREECRFEYRDSLFKRERGRFIVLDVTLSLPKSWKPNLGYAGLDTLPATSDAATVMARVLAIRGSKLPDWRKIGNAGSFYHNPVVAADVADRIAGAPRYKAAGGMVKLPAAWLIEACGLKGAREGQAGIYEKHALVIVNHGGARHEDIVKLAARIKDAVRARFGIELVQEPLDY